MYFGVGQLFFPGHFVKGPARTGSLPRLLVDGTADTLTGVRPMRLTRWLSARARTASAIFLLAMALGGCGQSAREPVTLSSLLPSWSQPDEFPTEACRAPPRENLQSDQLNLTICCRYAEGLLANPRVLRFLVKNHPTELRRLQNVVVNFSKRWRGPS